MYKLVIACWVLVVGCVQGVSAQKRNGHPTPAASQEVQKADMLRLVHDKIGPNSESIPNKDQSFFLFRKDTVNSSDIPVLKYVVLRNADKRIVVEGSVNMGVVEWTSDYELTESKSLGSAQSNSSQTRKIDLRPYLLKN